MHQGGFVNFKPMVGAVIKFWIFVVIGNLKIINNFFKEMGFLQKYIYDFKNYITIWSSKHMSCNSFLLNIHIHG